MKFVSFFAGIGGIDLGLERAGHECDGQVENNPFCLKVLEKHWPDVWRYDDILTLKAEDIPAADLWTAGFPCQDISDAGKRDGLSGEQSGLFWDFMRTVGMAPPRYLLLENVAALLYRGLGAVCGALARGGYDAEWDTVSAGALGAHHLRRRVFIRAARADTRSLRPQRIRPPTKGPWTREQFERLVQTELRLSVPTGKSGGVSHGIPGRVQRLRSVGNAVVPQVAEYIGQLLTDSGPEPQGATP